MTASDIPRRVTVEEDGRFLAQADVHAPDDGGTVQAALHVEPGHLPAGARSRLVDDVLGCSEVRQAERVRAVVPKGEAEVLDALRDRLENSTVRAAGASVLLEADGPGQSQG